MKKYVTYTSDDGKFSHSDVKKVEQYEAKVKAEKERKAELKATKEARKAEVDEAINKAYELFKQFMKDYGTYETKYTTVSNYKGEKFDDFFKFYKMLNPSFSDALSFLDGSFYKD
jgi:hypothetical protein|uniref:Uncharacterized protein n=1 Tax=Phage sp. ctGns7 TaxID=2828003 RepID=A0A8S5S9X8_9VIRU|nr:MAG TPA: hypothetical protein [Phage sp. ctGns7]